jgi:hypothetical protein
MHNNQETIVLQGVNYNKPPFANSNASKAVQSRWERFVVNSLDNLDYVKDRFMRLSKDEQSLARKLVKKISTKVRDKFYKDLKFSFNEWLPINDIEFVHSHQRYPLLEIIKYIIKHIRCLELNPIKIAILKQRGKPDRYICYDGQHTLILLYLLGYKFVPIITRNVRSLAEIRELFRLENGKGYRKEVNNVEDFRQDWLSYHEDGCRDNAATTANQVQDLLVVKGMAMDGQGKIRNTLSRYNELKTLKTKKQRETYLDAYTHRQTRGIFMTKYPGMGSKESRLYEKLIRKGLTLKQINAITDFLYDIEGTTVAYPKSGFWNEVEAEHNSKSPESGIAFLRNKLQTDKKFKKALKKVGVNAI